MGMPLSLSDDLSWIQEDMKGFSAASSDQGRFVFCNDGLPGILIGDSGGGETVDALEPGDCGGRFRTVDPIGDQRKMAVIVLIQYPQHGLQASDGLTDKGFRGSHRTTSCRTGS